MIATGLMADIAVPQVTVWSFVGGAALFAVTLAVTRTLTGADKDRKEQEDRHKAHDTKHDADVIALQTARDDIREEIRTTRHELANRQQAHDLRISLLEQKFDAADRRTE